MRRLPISPHFPLPTFTPTGKCRFDDGARCCIDLKLKNSYDDISQMNYYAEASLFFCQENDGIANPVRVGVPQAGWRAVS